MTKSSFLKYIGIFALVMIGFFILDRFVKFLILEHLANDIIIIKDFFKITVQQNTGIAFSIPLPFMIQLILFPLLFIGGFYVILSYLNFNNRFVQIVVGCIAGGALSNLYDRIVHHVVIDYISISIYPVFNIADIGITVGIFLLIVFYGKIKKA